MIWAGIIWGIFFTHNFEQTDYFKCKYDKIPEACIKVEAEESK